MRESGVLLLAALDAACALKCPSKAEEETEDWLEVEWVAGFRIWQILFLVVAGIGALVVVCCCVTRCRIPRTRQEIEANHRRNLITQLFRMHLDHMQVDEVDLMWALEEVKLSAEKPPPPPPPSLVETLKEAVFKRWKNEQHPDAASADQVLLHSK